MDSLLSLNPDKSHCISALAYIFQLEPEGLLPNELDNTLLCTYRCLEAIDLIKPSSKVATLLETFEAQQYITLDDKFKIFPRNRWFCKLVILASLKHCKHLHGGHDLILRQALMIFRPTRNECIHLLRLIARLARLVHHSNALDLVVFAQTAALSPLNGFKQIAENISEAALRYISPSQGMQLLNVHLLPLKGISTSKFGEYVSCSAASDPSTQTVITRIIEMFENNIENREGSGLYRILLVRIGSDFEAWKATVWPQFLNKFQLIDCEGEFFQSLLKYWIPRTVMSYRSKLYYLIKTSAIPDILKGYILLETQKQRHIEAYEVADLGLLERLFCQEETRSIAFQIACCARNRTLPTLQEMHFVWLFLREQDEALNRDEARALEKFFIHVVGALAGYRATAKEYADYVIKYFMYGVSLLKTTRRALGSQILINLLNNEESPWIWKKVNRKKLAAVVEQALLDCKGLCPELCDLAGKVVKAPRIFTNEFLMGFIDGASKELSVKASDSVRNVTKFVATVQSNRENLQEIIYKALLQLFEGELAKSACPRMVFKAALLFEALNRLVNYDGDGHSEALIGIQAVCFPAAARMLLQDKDLSNQISNYSCSCKDLQCSVKDNKKTDKILEALYDNVCEHLLKNKNAWKKADLPKLMDQLVQVIERSSRRRPTTISADLLRHACTNVDGVNFKITLLDRTLKNLELVAPAQNLTIRKNPETRLVLHALCASDSTPQRHFLTWTLNHLLKTLSNDTNTNATVSSALHCLEMLMSDNTLHGRTFTYAPEVIVQCIRHFQNPSWVVRNASVQLAKSLIDRFLGVRIGLNNRSKSVDDLFQLFPQIAATFIEILAKRPLTDSALPVMQFFIASQLKARLYSTEISLVTREAFLQSFALLIKEDAGLYGLFAAKAFASLCLEGHIAPVVAYIVGYVIDNFKVIRAKHTIRNFVLLLQQLYGKYSDCIKNKPTQPRGLYVIRQSLDELGAFLAHVANPKQCDYLLVKVQSVSDTLKDLQKIDFNSNNPHLRVWLHNYLPFLLINTPPSDWPYVLDVILSKHIPECLEVKLLSIVVDRFSKFQGPIVGVLVARALNVAHSKRYLLMCYFKVLLLLFERCHNVRFATEDLLSHYDDAALDFYKVSLHLLILSTTVEAKSDKKALVVKSAFKHYQKIYDLDQAEDASKMLRYLYANSDCLCDKRRVLKLALLFLVRHGLWHFVSFITKSNIPTATKAMQTILDFECLRAYFGGALESFEFVNEFYNAICLDWTDFGDGDTFYATATDAFVDKTRIGGIVVKFLCDYCKFAGRGDWLEICSKVRGLCWIPAVAVTFSLSKPMQSYGRALEVGDFCHHV